MYRNTKQLIHTIMKNLTKLLLGMLFAGIIFTGCKEAEELLYVNFNADYETEFDVTVPPTSGGKIGTDGTFSLTETIEPTKNEDYKLYIDNIKEVDIQEVSGTFIELSEDISLKTGIISVTNQDYTATWEFGAQQIQVGTVLVLDNDQGQWDAMTDIMLGKKPFTVSIVGEIEEEDVTFTVLFKMKSVVTASPLQ